MDIYDVAIVGAGPAGAVFARELANTVKSLRILLIDGQSVARPKPCGGLLAPDAQKVLARMGLTLPNSILADPQIFSVETIDLPRRRVRYYQRHYLNMDRYAFDRWLISLVPESVDIYEGRCLSVREEHGAYMLELRRGDTVTNVMAKFVVGADGGGSMVRKCFFKDKMLRYVAIQQWFETKGRRMPYYSCIFDHETSDSCSWTIHKDGYVIFGGAFRRDGCRAAFDRQRSRLEAMMGSSLGRAIKTEACLVCSPRRWNDLIMGGKGIFLIGEAAGLISPSSFEGLSSAMLSGRILAEALAGGGKAGDMLRRYKRRSFGLRFKLYMKNIKRTVICTPALRAAVMQSGIQSIKKY